MSHLTQNQIHGLERRAKDLITQTGGFQHQQVRVGQTTLHNYTDPDMPSYQMPVDVAVELEIQRGKPLITEYMASLSGYRLIPVEARMEQSEFFQMTAMFGKEIGEFFSVMTEAMRDGEVDPKEAARGVKELDDIQEVVNEYRFRLQSIADGKVIELKAVGK